MWVGDDVLLTADNLPEHQFVRHCARVLQAASRRTPVYVMHGNRDFLLGGGFAQASGCQLIDDPCVLQLGSFRWLLSHGDAWCLDDTDYLAFRARVRQTEWQTAFLSEPLPAREAVARQLREQSEQRKRDTQNQGETFADVDLATAVGWLQRTDCQTLIHGHTHRPAEHDLGPGRQRLVLSDWDASATPARLEVLSIRPDGHWYRTPLKP